MMSAEFKSARGLGTGLGRNKEWAGCQDASIIAPPASGPFADDRSPGLLSIFLFVLGSKKYFEDYILVYLESTTVYPV